MHEDDKATDENNNASFLRHGDRPISDRPTAMRIEHDTERHKAAEEVLERSKIQFVSLQTFVA